MLVEIPMKFWLGGQLPPPQSPSVVHGGVESLAQTLLGLPVRRAKMVGLSKLTNPPRVSPDMQAGGAKSCAWLPIALMLALFAPDPLTTPESPPAGSPPQTRPVVWLTFSTSVILTLKPGLLLPPSAGQSLPASSKVASKLRSKQRPASLQSPVATTPLPMQGGRA